MSSRSVIFLVAAALMLLQTFSTVSAESGSPVGRTVRAYVDASRNNWNGTGYRPLEATVWYPAAEGTPQRPRTVDIWQFGSSQPKRPAPGGWPSGAGVLRGERCELELNCKCKFVLML